MILQAAMDLEIEGRSVQANLDFDTGLIGFTEIVDGEVREFHYRDGAQAFGKALFDKLEPLFAERLNANFKICRKGNVGRKLMQLVQEDK